MDCRRSAVLLMALLFGACGCTSLSLLRLSGTKSDGEDEVTHKASTYVAFGDFRARSAEAPENSPAARDQLREEAKLSYLKAIEVDPKYPPAYVALARVQSAAEDHSAAVKSYAKALDMSPTDAALWFELGICQCRMKDWPSALTNMRKGMDLDPNNRHMATAMGLALARAGQWDEAFAVLARVNGQAKAHYDLARMLRHVNQPGQARRHAVAAVAADSRFEAARALLREMDNPGAAAAPAQAPDPAPAQQPSAPAPAPAQQVQQAAPPVPRAESAVRQVSYTPQAGPELEPQAPFVPAPPSQPAPQTSQPAPPIVTLSATAPAPAPVEQPKEPVVLPRIIQEAAMPMNLPESVDRPIRVPPLPIIRIGGQAK